MSTTTLPTSQSEIIARALDESPTGLSPEGAKFFLSLQLAPRDRERMDELAEKARRGELADAEEREIDEYRRTVRLVELIKLKARIALQKSP